jgi:phosphoglycolate phosphatase
MGTQGISPTPPTPPTFQVRAVLIDLDGTLIDTIADLTAAANAMLADYQHPPLALDIVRSYVGRGIVNLVGRCFGGQAVPADAVARFRHHYRALNGRAAVLYPGVVEGLQALRARGLPLACITNKAGDFVPPLLQATGIWSYFDCIVCGDTLARAKPDPLPLQHACQQLGVAVHEALMIGDSLNDAALLPVRPVAPWSCVPYGYSGPRGGAQSGLRCYIRVPWSSLASARWLHRA